MRVGSGIFGAFVGIIVGFAGALLFAFKVAGGDDFDGAMLCIIAVPVGLLVEAVLGVILALRVLSYLQQPDPDNRKRRKKIALVPSLLVGIPALVVGMFWAVIHSNDPRNDPPSDQQLLANFRRHQTTLNQLIWMIKVDKRLTFVGQDLIRPNGPGRVGIAQPRIGDYRRLMRSAEVPCGFETTTEENGIDFYYWGIGCTNASENGYKGYAYLTKPPKNLLSNLSQCEDKKDGVRFYRHIQGCWYLFYECLSD